MIIVAKFVSEMSQGLSGKKERCVQELFACDHISRELNCYLQYVLFTSS